MTDTHSAERLVALVAEPDGVSRAVLADHFRSLGYDVVATRSHDDTLSAAAGRPFHVALCNVDIPALDGLELRRRLERGAGEEVPLLFTSSRPDRARDRFVLRDAPLLMQPISRAQLREALRYVDVRRGLRLRRHHSSLSGNLADFTVSDLCLFMREHTLSGVATFLRGAEQGELAFSVGEPVRAETKDAQQDRAQGAEAFQALLRWEGGAFDVQLRDSRADRNLHGTLDVLLEEAFGTPSELAESDEARPAAADGVASREDGRPDDVVAETNWRERVPSPAEEYAVARGDLLLLLGKGEDRAALLAAHAEKLVALPSIFGEAPFSGSEGAANADGLLRAIEQGAIELVDSSAHIPAPDGSHAAVLGASLQNETDPVAPSVRSEPNQGAQFDDIPVADVDNEPDRLAAPSFNGRELSWDPPEAELVDDDEFDMVADPVVREVTPPGGFRPLAGAQSSDTPSSGAAAVPADAAVDRDQFAEDSEPDEPGDTLSTRDAWNVLLPGVPPHGGESASESEAPERPENGSPYAEEPTLPGEETAPESMTTSTRADDELGEFAEFELDGAEAKWASVESGWHVEEASDELSPAGAQGMRGGGPLAGWKGPALALGVGGALVALFLSLLPSDRTASQPATDGSTEESAATSPPKGMEPERAVDRGVNPVGRAPGAGSARVPSAPVPGIRTRPTSEPRLPSDGPGSQQMAAGAGAGDEALRGSETDESKNSGIGDGGIGDGARSAPPARAGGEIASPPAPARPVSAAVAPVNPRIGEATLERAVALADAGELREAERMLEVVVQSVPEDIRAAEWLAALWADRGRVDDARRLLARAVGSGGASLDALLSLAVLEQRDGDPSRARELYEQFMAEASPQHPYLERARALASELP